MNKNENTKSETTARLASLGRKATSDLAAGDKFSHSYLGDLEFLGWVSQYESGVTRSAYVVEVHGDREVTRCVPLNIAGSVKMMEN